MTPMNWSCEQTEARLSDYLDGVLSAEESAAFDAHVPGCPQCAPLFASVSQLVANLQSMQAIEESPRLVYAILDQTLGPRESVTGWRGLVKWLRELRPRRIAYGLASVAATFLAIASAFGFSLRKPKLSDLRPASIYRNVDSKAHLAYARGAKFVSDLRVVNEVQARFRESVQVPASEPVLPETAPNKGPGRSDGSKPGTHQQNRADGIYRNLEVLADELPVLIAPWNGRNAP